MSDKETWSNAGAGEVWILTFDHSGKVKQIPIRSGGKAVITVEERKLNQDRAASVEKDFFMNGSLTPIRLVDTAEDYHEISSNPNLLSEDDMLDLFKLKGPAFRARLADVTNVIALRRMLDIAKSDDAATNVTMTQFKILESRITDLSSGPPVAEVIQSDSGIPSPKSKASDLDF